MSSMSVVDSDNLDNRRRMLEMNVDKLRTSLRRWQAWSAEYEGLKEEVLALSEPSATDLQLIRRTYSHGQLTDSELEDILGTTSNNPRTAEQIVNVLDRRLEYVSQNIKTLEVQVEDGEQKLNAVVMPEAPDVLDEDALPLLDIIEELDDEDHVIHGRVEIPGGSYGTLAEILGKIGIKEDVSGDDTRQDIDRDNAALLPTIEDNEDLVSPTQRQGHSISTNSTNRGVSHKTASSSASEQLRSIMDRARVLERPITAATIPEHESPEDSAMRKEMLRYGMSEVGAVVAELDLEESSDVSDFDDEGYDDEDEDVSSLDDEDRFGKSTRSAVDADMHERMEELERKLGFRDKQNCESGEAASLPSKTPGYRETNARTSAEDRKHSTSESQTTCAVRTRRSVRFADQIDVSISNPSSVWTTGPTSKETVAPSPRTNKQDNSSPTQRKPMSTLDIEMRNDAVQQARSLRTIPVTTRHSWTPETVREVPAGPEGTILAKVVQERDISTSPTQPDDLDSQLLYQEAATEYYKRRNLIVQRQGGFRGRDADEETTGRVELAEEEGGPKKLSRFRAARLAKP